MMIIYIHNYLEECVLTEPIKAVTFSIKGSNMSFPIDVASTLAFILGTVPRPLYASTERRKLKSKHYFCHDSYILVAYKNHIIFLALILKLSRLYYLMLMVIFPKTIILC